MIKVLAINYVDLAQSFYFSQMVYQINRCHHFRLDPVRMLVHPSAVSIFSSKSLQHASIAKQLEIFYHAGRTISYLPPVIRCCLLDRPW